MLSLRRLRLPYHASRGLRPYCRLGFFVLFERNSLGESLAESEILRFVRVVLLSLDQGRCRCRVDLGVSMGVGLLVAVSMLSHMLGGLAGGEVGRLRERALLLVV